MARKPAKPRPKKSKAGASVPDWRLALDPIVHGANYFDQLSTATAFAIYDALSRLVEHEVEPNQVKTDPWVAEVRSQQGAEVYWFLGDTFDRPAVLPPHLATTLLIPNDTRLDSTAEITQAALKRFSELEAQLAKHRKERATRACGETVDCGAAGRFSSVAFAVCREPGKAALVGLEACLRRSLCPAPYGPQRAVIPVWGGEDQLVQWADALLAVVIKAPNTQAGVRLPLLLTFRPEDENRALRLERLLIKRGVLVGRESDFMAGDCGPEAAIACVKTTGPVTPARLGSWFARGVRLPAALWDRFTRAWAPDGR